MGMIHQLLVSEVMHARARPKRNAFRYHVYYLVLSLGSLGALSRLWLMSLNRFNLFSLYARDYGRGQEPEAWIRAQMAEWGITAANGDVLLMTMPRILGYAFNPVSFWFCLDADGGLRAVLADVKNTFGERHAYWLHHDDQRVIGPDDLLTARKIFHVSPFIEITGHYQFRFVLTEKRIGVWIDHYDADGLLLATSVVGKREALRSRRLLACFLRYPLVTVKVIGLIHYQALRLVLKGIRYHVKPQAPTVEISR